MATISERLAYVLTFDTSSGVKSLQTFGKTADKELGKADQKLDKLGAGMAKFGAGAVAFAGLAGAGLVKMASGAAAAEANAAALEQVVGELVANDVKKWAEGSAQGVGVASKDAVAAATSFGQLGKIIGLGGEELGKFSTDLVSLSADFAAFKDVSPEQALQDIQAGFAGSTEVLRKYGIFLDDASLKAAYFRETGEEVSGTLTAQQKIVAINAELYRQGGDMIGQWGRESEGLAGQQAILKASLTNLSDNIGAGILPMLTEVVGVATKVTGALSSMSPEAQAMVGRFAALGVAGIGLIGTLSMVAGQVIKMRDRFKDAEGGLTGFGKVAKGVGIAMGIAGVALVAYSVHAATAAQNSRDTAKAIEGLSRASDDKIVGQFAATLFVMGLRGKGAAEAIAEVTKGNAGATARMLELEDATGALTTQFLLQGISAEEAAERIDLMEQSLADEAAAQKQATATQEAGTAAIEGGTEATEEATEATDEYRFSHERVGRALDLTTQKFDAMSGRLSDRSTYLTAEEGLKALAAQAVTTGDVTESQVIDMQQQVLDYGQTLTDEASKEHIATINTAIDQGDYTLALYALAQLEKTRTVRYNIAMGSASGARLPGSRGVPEFHSGGIAGEGHFRSDEVPAVLQKGEMVLTEGQQASVASALTGGGGTTNITVNVNGGDPNAVVNAIRQYVRRNGPIGGIT